MQKISRDVFREIYKILRKKSIFLFTFVSPSMGRHINKGLSQKFCRVILRITQNNFYFLLFKIELSFFSHIITLSRYVLIVIQLIKENVFLFPFISIRIVFSFL
jgi:hypothetical protein